MLPLMMLSDFKLTEIVLGVTYFFFIFKFSYLLFVFDCFI